MEEKQQRQSVREALADKFISILESDEPLQWVKSWSTNHIALPYNGQTGYKYSGINRMALMFSAMERDYTDPRYYTFKQVSKMDGCKIRSGEKGTGIEYWYIYDTKEKRSMSFDEYERLLKTDSNRKEDEFRRCVKTSYVFNAAQVEGLQPLPQTERVPLAENKLADEVIKVMSENMGVRLVYGGNEAFYRPSTDTIHLPPDEAFFSTSERISTTLHELSHSTAAPARLNRTMVRFEQDPAAYAKEELFAELASSFVAAEIDLTISDSVIENNRAYVQHWLSAIKKDHNVLFSAIKEADKIADYLIDQGRVETIREKLEMEAQLPKPLPGLSYEIWQLKDTPENNVLQFANYAFASQFRLTESRYNKVYEAQAGEDDDALDKIFVKFNIYHPEGFTGHSLSLSDVVVLNDNGKRTAYFVDSVGFREVPGFCKALQTEKRGRSL